jgi:hypothetical protein
VLGRLARGRAVNISIIRTRTSDQGTFGMLTCESFTCFTGELPWRDNWTGISCIPPGEYQFERWKSVKYPRALHICDVPGRVGILIHQGNFCGDARIGFRSNVLGCVLVGDRLGVISGQEAVLNSTATLRRLVDYVQAPGTVHITEAYT